VPAKRKPQIEAPPSRPIKRPRPESKVKVEPVGYTKARKPANVIEIVDDEDDNTNSETLPRPVPQPWKQPKAVMRTLVPCKQEIPQPSELDFDSDSDYSTYHAALDIYNDHNACLLSSYTVGFTDA